MIPTRSLRTLAAFAALCLATLPALAQTPEPTPFFMPDPPALTLVSGDPLDAILVTLTPAGQTTATQQLEAEIRATPLADYPALETRMLAILKNPAATPQGKFAACRALREVGGPAALPILEPLLADLDLADAAHYALAGIALQDHPGRVAPTLDAPTQALVTALLEDGASTATRVRSLILLARADAHAAAPLILENLGSENPALAAAAARAGYLLQDPPATFARQLVELLPALAPESRARAIALLGWRKVASAAQPLIAQLDAPDAGVRASAVSALADVGSITVLDPVLGRYLTAISTGNSTDTAAMRSILVRLHGPDIDTELTARATAAGIDPGRRGELVSLLEQRMAVASIPAFEQMAASPDTGEARLGWHALGEVAPRPQIQALVDRFVKLDQEPLRGTASAALVSAGKRGPNGEALMDSLLAAYATADTRLRTHLLEVMGKTGGTRVFGPITEAVVSEDVDLKDAGVRALATWPTDEAAPPLLDLAQHGEQPKYKILALQGYLSLAGTPNLRTPAESLEMVEQATPLITRVEEKRQLLSALGSITDPAALRLALPYLDDPDLNAEAGNAVAFAAVHARGSIPDEAKAALQAVVDRCTNAGMQQYAKDRLAEMQ
jgi:HEAT repeat protein